MNSFNTNLLNSFDIQVIDSEEDAKSVISYIQNDSSPVIGVDIEAAAEMSRFGILCLLQIAYNNCVYIFDMVALNALILKDLLLNDSVVKIFHDCSEDCSLINNLLKIEIRNVFDTQIAHRICYEKLVGSSVSTKHSNISLNAMIKEYLNLENSIKDEICEIMKKNIYFWKTRPLDSRMKEYAARDVIYLPVIYKIFKDNCEKNIYNTLNVEDIQNECVKYLRYTKINLNIRNFNKTNIEKDKCVEGLIKNIQKNCIYIQLNIGYNGIINDKKAIIEIKNNHKLGDILYFKIIKLDEDKKRYILDTTDQDLTDQLKKISLNINKESFFPQSYKKIKLDKSIYDIASSKTKLDVNKFYEFKINQVLCYYLESLNKYFK